MIPRLDTDERLWVQTHMNAKSAIVFCVAGLGAVLLASLLLHIESSGSVQTRSLSTRDEHPAFESPISEHRAESVVLEHSESVPDPAPVTSPVQRNLEERPSSSASSTKELSAARHSLQSAIEASLFGVMDAQAIADAVLTLGDLPVDRGAPELTHSGTLQYRLLDVPDGIARAEFWVQRTAAQDKHALSLYLEVKPPSEPYILEGAQRKGTGTAIMIKTDDAGKPLEATIMTSVPAMAAGEKLGLPVTQGKIIEGLTYFVDLSDAGRSRITADGLDNSQGASWEVETSLVGKPWPGEGYPERLGKVLWRMYSSVRNNNKENGK